MKAVAAVLAMAGNFFLWVFWASYVNSIMWGWFIVPLGFAPLTYLQCAGIQLTLSAFLGLRGMGVGSARDPEWDALATLFMAAIFPAFALFWGWVFHSLFM
jgi:hypothetical protein